MTHYFVTTAHNRHLENASLTLLQYVFPIISNIATGTQKALQESKTLSGCVPTLQHPSQPLL